MPLFKLTQANNQPICLPPHSIRSVEDVTHRGVDGLAEARSFIRYDLGDGLEMAHLLNDAEETVRRLGEACPPAKGWGAVSIWQAGKRNEAHDRLWFDPAMIVAVRGLDPDWPGDQHNNVPNDGACGVITIDFSGDQMKAARMKLSIYEGPEQIEALIDGRSAPAPAAPRPNRRARRASAAQR